MDEQDGGHNTRVKRQTAHDDCSTSRELSFDDQIGVEDKEEALSNSKLISRPSFCSQATDEEVWKTIEREIVDEDKIWRSIEKELRSDERGEQVLKQIEKELKELNRTPDEEVWRTLEKELGDAATKIQSKYRGYRTRKRLRREDAVQVTTDTSEETATIVSQLSTGEFHDAVLCTNLYQYYL